MTTAASLFPEYVGSCFDVMLGPKEAPYLTLTSENVFNWATIESNLSTFYKTNDPEISSSLSLPNGRTLIDKLVTDLDATFKQHYPEIFETEYKEKFRPMFLKRLEDPGMLHNAIYFHVATDLDMIGFYWWTWFGDMAKSMDFLHDYCWDPLGRGHPVNPDGAWYHMSRMEGMNNSERIKVHDFVKHARWTFYKLYDRPRFTLFGGGNIPERHYDLPPSMITVFDPNTKTPVEKLFDKNDHRWTVNYLHENLFEAVKHTELYGTQSAVEMYGTALYLGPEKTHDALLVGEKLLHEHGRFTYDYIVLNESMRRVFTTQFWHVAQNKTDIFMKAGDAIDRGLSTVAAVNDHLRVEGADSRFMVENVMTTTVGIWGATGVRLFLKKVRI